MSEEVTVKATTTAADAADAAKPASQISLADTEEIKGSSHVDDGVSRLRLRPGGELDDLLGGLEELRHPRPRTTGSMTLEHEKGQVKTHIGKKNPLILDD